MILGILACAFGSSKERKSKTIEGKKPKRLHRIHSVELLCCFCLRLCLIAFQTVIYTAVGCCLFSVHHLVSFVLSSFLSFPSSVIQPSVIAISLWSICRFEHMEKIALLLNTLNTFFCENHSSGARVHRANRFKWTTLILTAAKAKICQQNAYYPAVVRAKNKNRKRIVRVFVCHASIGIVGLLICANNISQSFCAIYLRHTEANAFIRSLPTFATTVGVTTQRQIDRDRYNCMKPRTIFYKHTRSLCVVATKTVTTRFRHGFYEFSEYFNVKRSERKNQSQ